MKTVILCGGRSLRMQSETEFRPKPLVEVGSKPILWHIMKIYAHYGFSEFILTLGYKGEMIKEWFAKNNNDKFEIIFADTGEYSSTGERVRKIKHHINEHEFMITYGDGVADVDIAKLAAFHRDQGTIGTITGANPYSKYGFLKVDNTRNLVLDFDEKPLIHDSYVNSGFMVFNKKIFDYLDDEMLEIGLLPRLAKTQNLSVYRHHGFWKSMDTPKEAEELNDIWRRRQPWAVWGR